MTIHLAKHLMLVPIYARGIQRVLDGERHGALQTVRSPGSFVQSTDPRCNRFQISLGKPFGIRVDHYGRRLDRSRKGLGLRLGPGRRSRLRNHIRDTALEALCHCSASTLLPHLQRFLRAFIVPRTGREHAWCPPQHPRTSKAESFSRTRRSPSKPSSIEGATSFLAVA
jgi:hypothetical protein